MKRPQHQNPSREDRTAHAPYNFVPLPEKVITAADLRSQDRYYNDCYTGYLDCHLTTRSPLYVRCALTLAEIARRQEELARRQEEPARGKKVKDPPDFFYTDPESKSPVIPGSSLRGMLRALVEIVGYAKVQPVSDSLKVTFRAVAASSDDPLADPYRDALGKFGRNVQAGYLKRQGEQWFVHPALRPSTLELPERSSYLKVKDRHIPAGAIPGLIRFSQPGYRPQHHDVSFDTDVRRGERGKYVAITSIGGRDAGYRHRGVLVCSGNMLETDSSASQSPRKNYALVLERDPKSEALSISQQTVRDYLDSLTPFQKESPFDEKWGCLVDGFPVFYTVEKGRVTMFGHCPNFRVPARLPGQKRAANPLDFVPDSLRDPNQTDLAEAMFGYVEPTRKSKRPVACAGRVFISDARLEMEQRNVWLSPQPFAPRILASPKPTTFQHYLVQTTPDDKKRLAHYGSPTPGKTVIRGHKLYWHKGNVGQEQIAETEDVGPNDTQHTRFKPVRSGVRFRFRMCFENLSEIELGALLWALTLPGAGEYCHKLGMAKPLGMGSVKIESELHLTDRHARYQALFDGDGWELGQGRLDAEDVQRQTVQSFERAVLDEDVLNPGGKAQSLAEVPRIQTVLALLSWPGPSPEKTGYVTDLKEFTARKVLPTPLAVTGEGVASPKKSQSPIQPPPTSQQRIRPPVPTAPKPTPPPKPTPQPQESTPLSIVPGPHTGAVTYFNLKHGEGRILPDGSETEIKIQIDQLRAGVRYLVKHQRVSFTIVRDDDGGVHLENVGPV